eukprot:4437141-Pyramimonas_sp.AAC.2
MAAPTTGRAPPAWPSPPPSPYWACGTRGRTSGAAPTPEWTAPRTPSRTWRTLRAPGWTLRAPGWML